MEVIRTYSKWKRPVEKKINLMAFISGAPRGKSFTIDAPGFFDLEEDRLNVAVPGLFSSCCDAPALLNVVYMNYRCKHCWGKCFVKPKGGGYAKEAKAG